MRAVSGSGVDSRALLTIRFQRNAAAQSSDLDFLHVPDHPHLYAAPNNAVSPVIERALHESSDLPCVGTGEQIRPPLWLCNP